MRGHFMNRAFFGLLLIGAGVVFLLRQMNVITVDIGYLFSTFWPVFLIFFGLKGIVEKVAYRGGSFFWSAMLILIGLFFLGRNLGLLDLSAGDFFKSLFPVMLVVFGLAMLFRPHGQSGRTGRHHGAEGRVDKDRYENWRRNWQENWNQVHGDPFAEPAAKPADEPHAGYPPGDPGVDRAFVDPRAGYSRGREERDRLREERRRERERSRRQKFGEYGWNPDARNYSGFFNDLYLGHDYWNLEPMNISHFIGDTVIDLTKAQIPAGETKIVVSSFIGDVKVFIPDDMDVAVSVASSTFIGDLTLFDRHDSGFLRSHHAESPNYADAEKKVRFQVSMFIGDIKVQKVG